MKYFLDTEFLEGTQKEKFPISLFRKKSKPTIELISIGIVAEDGREYYAISKDFNLDEAWNRFELSDQYKNNYWIKEYWIRDNVLRPIWRDLYFKKQEKQQDFVPAKWLPEFKKDLLEGKFDGYFNCKSLQNLIKEYGKTNKEIAIEVQDFCTFGSAMDSLDRTTASVLLFKKMDDFTEKTIKERKLIHIFDNKPVFYGYYADYDWVVFCWLFGKMIDLPTSFPMFCIDLKQMFDEKLDNLKFSTRLRLGILGGFKGELPLKTKIDIVKKHRDYPKQENEHSAIDDARWNKELYNFINNI